MDRWQEAGAQYWYRETARGDTGGVGSYCYIDGRNLSWKVWEIFVVVAEREGQTGKGGWVCGRMAGGRRRERRRGRSQALPSVAPFLPQVRTPSSPPPPSTSDLRSLFVWGHSSTWPHDPVTPSSSLRGPGELPAEGAASSRKAVGANATRHSHNAAGGLSCRAGLLDRDRRGRGRRGGKWNVHVGLCSRSGCRGRTV